MDAKTRTKQRQNTSKQIKKKNAIKYANTVNHLEIFLKIRLLLLKYGDFVTIAFGMVSFRRSSITLSAIG